MADPDMTKTRYDCLMEIAFERESQDNKWGEQNHHPVYWIAVIAEEHGEAAKKAIEFKFENYREELVHLAAVTLAAIESLDRDKWPRSESEPQGKAVDVPIDG